MDDKKLENMLNKIDIPQPSDDAKRSAIADSVAEFKKVKENSKGIANSNRLTTKETNLLTQLWSNMMKKTTMIGGTATAIALVLAVSLTTEYQPPIKIKDEASTSPAIVIDGRVGQKVENKQQIPAVSEQKADIGRVDSKFSGNMVKREILEEQEVDFATSSDVMALSQSQALTKPATIMVKAKELVARKRTASPMMFGDASIGGLSINQPMDMISPIAQQFEGNDKFGEFEVNPIKLVKEEPVSTFSIDVDTASYTFMRRQLNHGALPQKDAVRIEEFINYFNYDYALPEDKSEPFKPSVTVYPTPWNAETKLMHIGIKAYDIEPDKKPRSNLVFLLDVSGSMSAQDKLPLLKNGFKMMVENLNPEDTVAIAVYAGSAGTVLEPTKVADKHKIIEALDKLQSGGSTAGGQGIKLAYSLAEQNFDKDAVNRVILATDGDFNVGITNQEELKSFVERKRKTGVFLSVLGFGQGNYNDALMQTLAQNGNGNAAYIDSLSEARKVLVEEAGSTLFTIAKDVKIQVEFNPYKIAEYHLIGYETRKLRREDFNNDKIDAGEIGSGHSVTAIYEITPVGSKGKMVDDLRYGKVKEEEKVTSDTQFNNEYANLKIRYKLPDSDTSKLMTRPVTIDDEVKRVEDASGDVKFATAVAAYAQIIREDGYTKDFSYDDVITLGKSARGDDEFGYRSEFLNLVRLAKSVKGAM